MNNYIISKKNITDGTQYFFQSKRRWASRIEEGTGLSRERAKEIAPILAKAYKETDIIEIIEEDGTVEIIPG